MKQLIMPTINLEDVKLIQYIKEHGLTLANLKQV